MGAPRPPGEEAMKDTSQNDEEQRDDGVTWPGFTRRAFIQSFGAGTVTLAVGRDALSAPLKPDETQTEGRAVRVTLDVNGRSHQVLAEPRWTLLHVLRERLGLTAAKIGCERGECGSCTVLIDDVPRYACLTLAVEAEGRRIETAEGLMDGERLGQVQASFVKEDGLQCGYCTPGQIMAAEGLLRRNPSPSFDEIRAAMSGNLCRCGTYSHIFNAVADAAKHRKG
jgi:xanthine dehydrogenase YagT iron-sulfur-binding subunit